jgi:hypothetical protein
VQGRLVKSWLCKLLGCRLPEENRRLKVLLSSCTEDLTYYRGALDVCESTKDKLFKRIESLEGEISNLKQRIDQLEVDNRKLIEEKEKLSRDVEYLTKRLRKLSIALGESVYVHDVSKFVVPRKVVKPYEVILGYNLLAADLEYYAFTFDNWKSILGLVHSEVYNQLKAWKTNVSDCDDWALLTVAFTVPCFVKAGLDKQGALSVVWSGVHAYNMFVDFDGVFWVYEPQTNRVVGRLGETSYPYDSRIIWFPQKKV